MGGVFAAQQQKKRIVQKKREANHPQPRDQEKRPAADDEAETHVRRQLLQLGIVLQFVTVGDAAWGKRRLTT